MILLVIFGSCLDRLNALIRRRLAFDERLSFGSSDNDINDVDDAQILSAIQTDLVELVRRWQQAMELIAL
jgi:hypothetical protein